MEDDPPSTLAMPGNMNELKAVSDASPDDFCPYPPAPGHPFWVTAILFSIILFVVFKLFKWAFERFAKQRLKYAFIENTMLTLAPFLLDAERAVMKFPFLGKRIIKLFFWVIQRSVPYPPRHLMSSAPSNSPGILTVLKENSELAAQCKYQDKYILTSDDFPVLPTQPRIFRTVDGFGNCPYSPHIGQAAQPYSFVALCQKPEIGPGGQVIEKKLPSTEAVFDTLFKRKAFEPNEAGLNCLILDFATVLTHDLFNSHNGYNENSSYADLSPLYGNDADSARRVRVFKRGLLDLKKVPYSRAATVEEHSLEGLELAATKDEKEKERLRAKHAVRGKTANAKHPVPSKPAKVKSVGDAGLEALQKEDDQNFVNDAEEWNWDWGFVGWRALVEVFGKEHNHVARKLLEWYPEKFSHEFVTKQEELCVPYDKDGLPQDNSALKGCWINDEALYQTARYITTRIYGNIIVTDYASNFLGLKQLNDFFVGRPEKLGNCCSYEFGLLYHWHCLLPDDFPNAKEVKGVPCNKNDPIISKRGPLDGDYYDQLSKVKPNAHERTFKGLLEHQEANLPGKVDQLKKAHKGAHDEEPKSEAKVDPLPDTQLKLDDLLLSRYNTRIGRFGAFHTPEYLRQAEMRTMDKARKLGIGSYNDFRAHLNLMRCTTYEEINPDPKVAGALRQLYEEGGKGNENVDNVELYPGVFAERSGRHGIKFGNVLSLGLLEDALNLIRNDRLLVDFDAATATPKGYQHAVTSHFADVIERNTGLKLVKQAEGPTDVLADYRAKYAPDDWRHWRLASAALLTVPDEKGTVRKEIFEDTKSTPAKLVKFKWPQAAQEDSVPAGEETGAGRPRVAVSDTPVDTSKPETTTPTSTLQGVQSVGTPRGAQHQLGRATYQ